MISLKKLAADGLIKLTEITSEFLRTFGFVLR